MKKDAMHNPDAELPFRVLLYYKFTLIADPEGVREAQEAFCSSRDILGRILIGQEGINGTLSGPVADVNAYMEFMQQDPQWAGIEFKVDPSPGHAFSKLNVRVKEEVIRFDVGALDLFWEPDNYVEPEEWREVLKQAETDENIVILDTRSDYEFEVGKFKHAQTLPIHNFRELPEHSEELEALRGKKIYTYCTGGIRCEKVTLWMREQGFEDVYQLHGGIIRYGHEVGGEDFEGGCYVFDQRVIVPVNSVNPTVIGRCKACQSPTERMVNCANADCNDHILICDECLSKYEGACSEACMNSPRKREFDGRGYYVRGQNSKLFSQNPDPNYVRQKEKESGNSPATS